MIFYKPPCATEQLRTYFAYGGAFLLLTLIGSPNVKAAGGPPPALVVTAEAVKRELAPIAWVAGTVISRNNAQLSTEVSGRMNWVAEVGTWVTQDEIVAQLDDVLLVQQVIEQEGAISREQARLVFFEQEVKLLTRLAKQNNAAQRQLDQAISDRAIAKGELLIAQARLRGAKELLNRTKLRAPFAGVISERFVQAGEWADSGDGVIRLVDPSSLEVQARVPQTSLAYIKEGIELKLSTSPQLARARIRTVVPVGDDQSRLYEIRLTLPEHSWVVGQTLRVAVPTAPAREVIAIPRDALVLRRDGIRVFRILEDETAQPVMVKTGIANDHLIEIIGDIRSGDKVVIRGGERLRPGQKVKILSNGKEP